MFTNDCGVPQHNEQFKAFVQRTLCTYTALNLDQVNKLTDAEGMVEFSRAFTSKTHDETFHYEFYEMMGDATSNKIVVWYFQRRFPEMFKPETAHGIGNMSPVAIMARLKMNGINERSYSGFARKLGFDAYIRSTEHVGNSVCEDVFESFIGCLEVLADRRFGMHVGYAICYDWMRGVLDKCCRHIDLSHESLYDAKSRVNELKNSLGKGLQMEIETEALPDKKFKARYVLRQNNRTYECPWSSGARKKDAEQNAAKQVLLTNAFEKFRITDTANARSSSTNHRTDNNSSPSTRGRLPQARGRSSANKSSRADDIPVLPAPLAKAALC